MPPANDSDGGLSAGDFQVWMRSRELTKADAGRMLGVVYQTISHYEKNGTSKMTALAIAAVDRGIPPFTPTDEDRRIAALHAGGSANERIADIPDQDDDGQL